MLYFYYIKIKEARKCMREILIFIFEKGFIISVNIDYGILGGKWKRIVVNLISFFLIITLILKLHELL